MGCEIERKFLVKDDSFLELAEYSRVIKQGYLTGKTENNAAYRVRISGDKAFLTLKGQTHGIRRAEFEYPVPVQDAEEMLEIFCGDRVIEKTRYYLHYEGFLWEVDVFGGRHKGLMIAEIELDNENVEFALPPFAGEEVSERFEYSNFSLSMS